MPITSSPVPWSYALVTRDDVSLPPGAVVKDFNGHVIASFECARDAEKVVEIANGNYETVIDDLKNDLVSAEMEIRTLETSIETLNTRMFAMSTAIDAAKRALNV